MRMTGFMFGYKMEREVYEILLQKNGEAIEKNIYYVYEFNDYVLIAVEQLIFTEQSENEVVDLFSFNLKLNNNNIEKEDLMAFFEKEVRQHINMYGIYVPQLYIMNLDLEK